MTTRRDILKAAAVAPLAMVPISNLDAMKASLHATAAIESAERGAPYVPKFFKPDEWPALRIIVDMIIPRDEHSGSATEAGVPEFMDWICIEYPSYQNTREALRWIDGFAYTSFDKSFAKCSLDQRKQLLDQIAWPKKAKKELAEGVAHFNRLRDFTASGFFSSRMGVQDLKYMGNVALPAWPGCPEPAMQHIGVSHDVMKTRIPSRY